MSYIDDHLTDHSRDITNLKDALRDLQWRVECLESLNAAREPTACGEAVASQPTYASGEVPMVGDVVEFNNGNSMCTFTVEQIVDDYVKTHSMMPYRIESCTLIRRASPPQPASEPASDGEKLPSLIETYIEAYWTSDKSGEGVPTGARFHELTGVQQKRMAVGIAAVAAACKAKDAEIAELKEQMRQTQDLLDHVKGENDVIEEVRRTLVRERDAALARAEAAEKEAAKCKPLQSLANEIREINKANGWNVTQPVDWSDTYKVPAILALITSEVSEALEAFRKDDALNFCEEMADTLIRVLDCIAAFDLDFDATVLAKLEKNKTRGHKHGGKRV